MKQGIPKAVQEALGRQMPADEHPSADLLNGYAEHALAADERSRVESHLAACADCREIVFLAGDAAPEETAPALAVPARPWVGWWKWAVPAVAGLAMLSSVLLYRQNQTHETAAPSTQIASNQPAPQSPPDTSAKRATPSAPETSPAKVVPVPQPQPHREAKLQPSSLPPTTAMGGHSRIEAGNHPPITASHGPGPTYEHPPSRFAGVPAAAVGASGNKPSGMSDAIAHQPSASLSSETVAVVSGTPPVAVPEKPSPGATTVQAAPSLPKTSSFAAARGAFPTHSGAVSVLPVRAFWRVSAEGHLERNVPGAGWTQVLADQPVTFRVVSIIGVNLWAGGNNGALFHSIDGGERWTQVVLSDYARTEKGNVVSIDFDTSAQGSVTLDNGAVWRTGDGGRTWTKQ